MEHEANLALTSLSACMGWLVALALLVIGLVPVRKAHATSGYLFAGAGALMWLTGCCDSLPTTLRQADQWEMVDQLGSLPALVSMLFWILTTAALLAGFVTLARHVVAQRAMGGAS